MKIPIEKIGNEYTLSGVVIGNADKSFVCMFPDETAASDMIIESLPTEDWNAILKQMDEVVIKIQGRDGVVKAMIRKSERLIDRNLMWEVFKRDNYRCCYCGRTGVSLTVDHYMPQERGGETTRQNLKTSCRSCNKRKGNMLPQNWEALMISDGL